MPVDNKINTFTAASIQWSLSERTTPNNGRIYGTCTVCKRHVERAKRARATSRRTKLWQKLRIYHVTSRSFQRHVQQSETTTTKYTNLPAWWVYNITLEIALPTEICSITKFNSITIILRLQSTCSRLSLHNMTQMNYVDAGRAEVRVRVVSFPRVTLGEIFKWLHPI